MDISENVLESGMRVWFARPESSEPLPLMVMMHERYGPVEHNFNVMQRMAEYGYVACFPDFFHRYEGDRGPLERSEDRCDPTDAQYIADLDETLAFMRAQTFVDSAKVGIVGFCQSGRVPMVYAAGGRDVTAIAFFHGGIYPRDYEPTFEGQESATTFLPRVNVPLLAGFGQNDFLVPMDNIRRFRGELESLGKRARVHVFGDTPHGWMNTTKPKDYRPEATETTWGLITEFFSEAFEGRLTPAPSVEFHANQSIDFDFST